MDFYQKDIGNRYHVPVRFFVLKDRIDTETIKDSKGIFKRVLPKRKSLERRIVSILSIGFLSTSILFSLSNFTGNVIRSSYNSKNVFGSALFVLGVIGAIIYFKSENNS
jgi:hypothetical protein